MQIGIPAAVSGPDTPTAPARIQRVHPVCAGATLRHPRHARRRFTQAAAAERRRDPDPDGLIPLTHNEIASLLAGLTIKPAAAAAKDRWPAATSR